MSVSPSGIVRARRLRLQKLPDRAAKGHEALSIHSMCRVRSGAWLAVKGMPCGVGNSWVHLATQCKHKTEGVSKRPHTSRHAA